MYVAIEISTISTRREFIRISNEWILESLHCETLCGNIVSQMVDEFAEAQFNDNLS